MRLAARALRQDGISLVEVLVASAISGLVITVVASLIFASVTHGRSMLQITSQYESLRLATAALVQDARFAVDCSSSVDRKILMLFLKPDWSEYVEYRLVPQSGQGTGLYDLHRIVEKGGNRTEEVLAVDLAPPGSSGSQFVCSPGIWYPELKVDYKLVKPLLPNQTRPLEYRGTVFLR